MKTFTQTEITDLENKYQQMADTHCEIVLEDMTQDNLNELIELMQIVCGESYKLQGLKMPRLAPMELSELDNSTLYAMINRLNESARDCLVIARTRRA